MKLLVTGAFSCTEEQLNIIKSLGNEVFFMQNENSNIPCDCKDIEGVICNGLFLHHDIKKFTSLKYIQLTSVGYDRVPLDYIKEKEIAIYNAKGVYSIPMAEFVINGVLGLYKNIEFFIRNKQKKVWEKNRNVIELYGKTVCIVGCGNVGTECAKRFKAFGCKVVGVDVVKVETESYDRTYFVNEIDEALTVSDIVVLTLPLTEQTKNFFDKEKFDKMKSGSVFVNISRGGVVNESDLIKAIDEKLFGAVLDVFENEPLSKDSLLWEKENVIITPHNSFVGENNNERLFKVIIDNFKVKK